MASAVLLAQLVVCLLLGFVPINGRTVEQKQPPQCATVMCERPCPLGQYLFMSEEGCETCDCYDPCEGFICEVGECHWMLNDESRPSPFCVDCRGGQEWSDCTGGRSCVATCGNLNPLCNRNCYPGCQCPPDRPVLHHGQCVTAYQCREACEGGQQWTEFGVENMPTCNNLIPFSFMMGTMSRCQCPPERPIWDDDRSLCVTEGQCLRNYYQHSNKK